MTENLLQKLEEKMVSLISEVEDLRKEIHRLSHENTLLKTDKETNARKVQELISLLDTIQVTADTLVDATSIAA